MRILQKIYWVLSADSVLWIQIGIWYVSWMPFSLTIIIEAVMVGDNFREYINFHEDSDFYLQKIVYRKTLAVIPK